MTRIRQRPSRHGFILLGFVFLGCLAFAVAAKSSSAAEARPSPSEDDLICHTDNPAECYPKLFQATHEFQTVREDQDLPPGLHVRLNIATGKKEAKINVPGEENPALEGLPVDSSIVVVDQPSDGDEVPHIPANAPAYDPIGKIKEPPAAETGDFYKSLSILKKGLDIDGALEMLEDISHDIYYGLKIAVDFGTLRSLFCLANTGAIFEPVTADGDAAAVAEAANVAGRARLAALTIASATQNNPKALAEIERHWPALQKEVCPGPNAGKNAKASSSENLAIATFRLVGPRASDREDPALAKVRVSAISGLLRSPLIRKNFLENGGMELLLEVLVHKSDAADWEPARRRAGLLVLDNFLDEGMGATLGDWPIRGQKRLSDGECAKRSEPDGSVDAGCWDWWAKKLAEENKKDNEHWTVELWSKLKERRKAEGAKEKTEKEL